MLNIVSTVNLNDNIINFINEIKTIVIPLNCNIYENVNGNDYFFRIPNKFKKYDYLELVRELWIKIPDSRNYF